MRKTDYELVVVKNTCRTKKLPTVDEHLAFLNQYFISTPRSMHAANTETHPCWWRRTATNRFTRRVVLSYQRQHFARPRIHRPGTALGSSNFLCLISGEPNPTSAKEQCTLEGPPGCAYVLGVAWPTAYSSRAAFLPGCSYPSLRPELDLSAPQGRRKEQTTACQEQPHSVAGYFKFIILLLTPLTARQQGTDPARLPEVYFLPGSSSR